ncbi:MAG: serine/threonine protein kinase [Phycisphaerales bacterium]|nr:serine/threonine protein kinase [Phycisphaerales bacterium]
MSADHFRRAAELFIQIRGVPLIEHDLWIRDHCAGEPEVEAELRRLVAAQDAPVPFATLAEDLRPLHEQLSPTDTRLAPSAARPPDADAASRIGPYRLLEKIGEGGFGVVYMAEQEQPVRRRVALKVVKLGMDTRQVVARFEAERQALALMDHPGIARVFDAGATESGRPFFVMELVKGLPITEYCDRERLDVEARLRLFVSVCRAVQHAHHKGVIHRDLKPGNILVSMQDGRPSPKVIDFGIAKATAQPLTDRTLFTEFRQMLGTPEYMSPEQADGLSADIDTRADIYSLGVILYEVLTGTTPFDSSTLRTAAYAEMQRIIREVEPPRPSTRLHTLGAGPRHGTRGTAQARELAERRRLDPAALARHLRGELDWIVMRALDKDRARRYSSAADLADDIERHLDDQPVLAGPPSASYRIRKFAKRNKTLIAAGAGVTLAMLGGAGGLTYGFVEADRQRDEVAVAYDRLLEAQGSLRDALAQAKASQTTAEESARRADAVAVFLRDMLASVAPDVALGRDTTILRGMLDEAEHRLRTQLTDDPAVRCEILHTIGYTHLKSGDPARAEPLLREAAELCEQSRGPEDLNTLSMWLDVAESLSDGTRAAESELISRRTLERLMKTVGPNHRTSIAAMNDLAAGLMNRRELVESRALFEEAIHACGATLHPDDELTLRVQANFANLLRSADDPQGALDIHLRVLAARERTLGPDHPSTVLAAGHVASDLDDLGRFEESEPYFLRQLKFYQGYFDGPSVITLTVLNNLAHTYSSLKRYDEAEAMLLQVIEQMSGLIGPDSQNTASSRQNLAALYFSQGRFADAVAQQDLAIDSMRRTPPSLPYLLPAVEISRARSVWKLGQPEEALGIIASRYGTLVSTLGEAHAVTRAAAKSAAEIMDELGRDSEEWWNKAGGRPAEPPGGSVTPPPGE